MIKHYDNQLSQATVARLADVSRADVSNYEAGRITFVTTEKRARIKQVRSGLSKAQLVLRWLESGRTLTPLESLRMFRLHSLSQTIAKLKARGHDIRNIGPGGPHDYAVYKLYERGE